MIIYGFDTKNLHSKVQDLDIQKIVNEDWFICSDLEVTKRIWRESIESEIETLNNKLEDIEGAITSWYDLLRTDGIVVKRIKEPEDS